MPNFLAFCDQLPELYSKITEIAKVEFQLQENPSHTWNPSDLVQEMLLKLFQTECSPENFECDLVFHSFVTRAMTRLLINYGERKRTQKRGGGISREYIEVLDDLEFRRDEFDEEKYLKVIFLLEELSQQDPREAEIFKLHWFSGQSTEEIANWHKLSKRTVQLELRSATAWLKKEVKKSGY